MQVKHLCLGTNEGIYSSCIWPRCTFTRETITWVETLYVVNVKCVAPSLKVSLHPRRTKVSISPSCRDSIYERNVIKRVFYST